MKKNHIALNEDNSEQWSEIQSQLQQDAKLHEQTHTQALHEDIMNKIQPKPTADLNQTQSTLVYLPYLAVAACVCIALLLAIPKKPVETEIPLLWDIDLTETLIQEANNFLSYESELEKLQADIDAGAKFLLNAIDLDA